jgi:hypothetical protein
VPAPRRRPHAVSLPAPAPAENPSPIRWSTDPDTLARVAERLRASFPWHDRPADPSESPPDVRSLAGGVPGPDILVKERK